MKLCKKNGYRKINDWKTSLSINIESNKIRLNYDNDLCLNAFLFEVGTYRKIILLWDFKIVKEFIQIFTD